MSMSTALLVAGLLALAALCGLIGVEVYRRTRPFLPEQPPREAETEPPHLPAPTEASTVPLPVVPVPHVGATEQWSPLAEIGAQPTSPDLTDEALWIGADWTPAAIYMRSHAEAKDLADRMLHDLDLICAWAQRQLDPLWARVDTDTSEWPVLTDEGLHAWMAGQPETAEVVR